MQNINNKTYITLNDTLRPAIDVKELVNYKTIHRIFLNIKLDVTISIISITYSEIINTNYAKY